MSDFGNGSTGRTISAFRSTPNGSTRFVALVSTDSERGIRHKWSPRGVAKNIAVLVAFILIPVCFVALAYGFARSVVLPPSNMACSLLQDPPHIKNRTVGRHLCAPHRENDAAIIKEALKGDDGIAFLVLGDFGRDGYCCQRDVAIEMDRIGEAIQAKFVLNSGDSFYEDGIDAVTDEEVQSSFSTVYDQAYIRNLEFWGVLGNHDYRGSTQALMDLSKTVEPRFLMESRWWSRVVKRPNNARDVRIIMIDTSPMISNYRTEDPSMKDHPEDGIFTQFDRVEDQMKWLEKELAQNRSEVKIVMGHHPAFSYFDYGTENRTFLETRVTSLLDKYNTTAYFAGHDHNLQYARPTQGATAYFVSGAGSRLRDGIVKAKPTDVQFLHVVHGFLACSIVDDGTLKVAAVDMYGKMVNSVAVP